MPPGPAPADAIAGFFRDLFDLRFRRLVTPRIIRVLYVVWLVVTVLALVAITIDVFDGDELATRVTFQDGELVRETGSDTNVGGGLLFLLIGCPLLFVLSAIVGRVQLELVIALFRIADNTTALREHLVGPAPRGPGAPAAPPAPAGGPATPAASGSSSPDARREDPPVAGGPAGPSGPAAPPAGGGPAGPSGPGAPPAHG